ELRAKIQNQLVKSPIKCIEEAKPYFRILANTAESEEEEYEDEALFETDLFQLENENEEREIHSDSEIDKDELECIEWPYEKEEFINLYIANVEENETVEQITVKALIPKEIISTGRTDIGQTPYVNHQIPLKLGNGPSKYGPNRRN
ncbi:17167_t:CDS:2, partial [Funneliformis geosporum]